MFSQNLLQTVDMENLVFMITNNVSIFSVSIMAEPAPGPLISQAVPQQVNNIITEPQQPMDSASNASTLQQSSDPLPVTNLIEDFRLEMSPVEAQSKPDVNEVPFEHFDEESKLVSRPEMTPPNPSLSTARTSKPKKRTPNTHSCGE